MRCLCPPAHSSGSPCRPAWPPGLPVGAVVGRGLETRQSLVGSHPWAIWAIGVQPSSGTTGGGARGRNMGGGGAAGAARTSILAFTRRSISRKDSRCSTSNRLNRFSMSAGAQPPPPAPDLSLPPPNLPAPPFICTSTAPTFFVSLSTPRSRSTICSTT